MNALLYATQYPVPLSLHIPGEHSNGPTSTNSSETDPILEDTPDALDDDVDYTTVPPEIGQTILIDECGCEISLALPPPRAETPFIYSPPERLSMENDCDDYPFHAVTYGETGDCHGLPYNDHNYALNEASSKSIVPEEDGHLSLLAKLALAKDEKQSDSFLDSPVRRNPSVSSGLVVSIGSSNNIDNHSTKKNCRKEVLNKNNFIQSSGSCNQLLITNTQQRLLPRTQSSKLTPSRWTSPSGNRPVILPSTHNTGKSPLQVHRISSSLTPQIVLRTSAPALHINTTASQFPAPDSVESGIIRCIPTCTRQDGCLQQCDKCKVWQHADCVSSANTSVKASPHLCERCTAFPMQFTSAPPAIHRSPPASSNKLACPSVTPVPGIRISRASPLSPTVTSAPGRIFVTTSAACSVPTTRQLHICLSNSPSFSATLGSRSDVASAETVLPEAQYVVTRVTPCGMTLNQPVRSSKRKQDLMTLTTGSTFNTGLDGISGTVSTVNTPSTVPIITGSSSVNIDGLTVADEVRQQQVPTTRWQPKPVGNNGGSSGSNSGGSLHRLLVQLSDRSNLEAGHQTAAAPASTPDTQNYDHQHQRAASPCSTASSDSIESRQSLDTYEDAVDLRLSDRLYRRLLDGILPTGSPVRQDLGGPEQPLSNKSSSVQRCKLVAFDFNHKVLVASEDLYPNEPIMEYRGTCMLRSEYTEVYDCRKHYNPFVLFYDTSKVAFCIDAKKYGNEARYIRRSCTPNCEVKHLFSMESASQSGQMPCMQFFIVAVKQIPKMSELTIAFDFDYTVCRYLVTCACGRKACPVSRWFRHGGSGQFGTAAEHRRTFLHQSNSSSLIYSRKLVTSTRGTGVSILPSRLPAAHHSISNGDSGSLKLHTSESVSGDIGTRPLGEHTWNHLGYRRGSGRPRNFPLSTSSKKSINACRRGRGRGRRRAGSFVYSDSRTTTTTATVLPARVSRGRPSKKSSALFSSESRYPRCGRAAQSRGYTTGHRVSFSHSNDAIPDSSDKVASDQGHSDSEVEDGEVTKSTDNQLECHLPNRHETNRASRFNRHSRRAGEREDVDTETDPEREDDQSHIFSGDQEVRESPPSVVLKNEKTMAAASTTHSKNVKRVFDDNLSKQDASTDSQKGSKTGSSIRTKRHHSVADSLSSKKTDVSLKDQPKKESREEMWMAEVLRRIERLEKKQSKQRAENAHDSSVKAKRAQDVLEDQPSSSAKLHENEVKPKPCFDFDSISGRAATEFNAVSDPRSPNKLSVGDAADAVDFWSSSKSPLTIKDMENFEVSDTLSEFSPTSTKLDPCRNNRRRRSQPLTPSDVPTSRASDEKRDSREERWLKSQLRRIAELETHDTAAPRQTSSGSASNKQTDYDVSMLSPSKESHVDIRQDGDDSLHDAPVGGVSQYTTVASPEKTGATEKTSPLSAVKTSDMSWDVSAGSVSRTDASSQQTAIDLEADCGLIVYRVREKDPMAKFSRRPSVCLPDSQNSQEDDGQLRCVGDESEYSISHSENFQHASSRPTCGSFSVHRPTKKRWLSQALLEGDRETLSNGLTASQDNSFDRSADKDAAGDGQQLGVNTATNVPTSATCPVNPKKRLLSQFSSTVDGSDPPPPMPADPLLYCQDPVSTNCFVGTVRYSEMVSTCTTIGDAPTDSAAQPTTPLPPKKATVKQQAEQLRLQEMRKTRVSLSEYRRRKGLCSLPQKCIESNKDMKQLDSHSVNSPKVTDADDLDIVVPEELGSSDLFFQLPSCHLHQFLPLESCFTPPKPDGDDDGKSPGISKPSSAHFLADESGLSSQFKVNLDEGGPRTPSEPPDDEDGDHLHTSVPPSLTQPPLDPVKFGQPSVIDSSNRALNEALSWSSTSDISGQSPSISYSRLNDARPLQSLYETPNASKVDVLTVNDMPTRRQSYPSSITSSQRKSFLRERFPSSGTHETACSNPSTSGSSSSREPGKGQDVFRECVTGCTAVQVAQVDNTRLPPPPPPPRPLFTAAQTSSDCLTLTAPTEVDGGGGRSRPSSLSSSHSRSNPVDYFIRRDQEIRMWQEARSYEWDRKQFTHRYQAAGQFDHQQQRHGRHHHTRGRHHCGQQPGNFAYDPRQTADSRGAKVPRTEGQPKSSVPADCHRLDDVEQTLFRLHDSLRIQLDQTRQALTHTATPRLPVNGDAVVVLPYRHDELTRLRRMGTGGGGYAGRSRKRPASPPTS